MFCSKPVSTQDKLRTHEKWCNVKVYCLCGAALPNMEAMTADSKHRKGHLKQGRALLGFNLLWSASIRFPSPSHWRALLSPSTVPGEHGLDEARIKKERAQRAPGQFTYAARVPKKGKAMHSVNVAMRGAGLDALAAAGQPAEEEAVAAAEAREE